MKVLCEISIGELVDKISILEIKIDKINDIEKNKFLIYELKKLLQKLNNLKIENELIEKYKSKLKNVNKKLWDVEDKLRILEKEKNFDKEFISLARSVYHLNDKRFEYKNKLNKAVNSKIQEVKSYQSYK